MLLWDKCIEVSVKLIVQEEDYFVYILYEDLSQIFCDIWVDFMMREVKSWQEEHKCLKHDCSLPGTTRIKL